MQGAAKVIIPGMFSIMLFTIDKIVPDLTTVFKLPAHVYAVRV